MLTSTSLWSKCRPYSRLLSVAVPGWIFIATDCPGVALSTCLWLSSMLAIFPMSMNPWLGMQICVPTRAMPRASTPTTMGSRLLKMQLGMIFSSHGNDTSSAAASFFFCLISAMSP